VRDAEAHYVLQVKENQPTLLRNIKEAAVEASRRRRPGEERAALDRYREIDKGHGRIEKRMCLVSHDPNGIERREEWRDLTGYAVMLRERQEVISGKTSQELSYFIISNPEATARDIAHLVRGHWGIENGLHWSMDVVWGSDAHGVRNRVCAENLARVRRFCAGLVKQATGWEMSGSRVRLLCGWNPNNILKVLSGEVISKERQRRPNRNTIKRPRGPAPKQA
jgi:predicted transposase YbfD/YdcC